MAQTALPAPRTAHRRRALFGLFDADGWGWAFVKSLFWFVVIITMLGYLPDRAYYFTVGRTVELWPFGQFLHWSPVNLCPAENRLSACPVPTGATLPWDISPAELRLPAGRTDGAATTVGSRILYVGGSDGKAAVADTYVASGVGTGNISKWENAPALPDARVDAAVVTVGNTVYAIGGADASGAPTTTTYQLDIATDGTIGDWKAVDALALPEARKGAAVVAVSDGLLVMGGSDANGPVSTVWKATADKSGKLGAWAAQNPLADPVTDALGVHVGDFVYVIGGTNATGPSGGVQVLDTAGAAAAPGASPAASPAASAAPAGGEGAGRWAVNNAINLPAARTNLTGFTSNGAIYVIGGSDGSALSNDVFWTVPKADGTNDGWKHMEETDLGSGVQGAAAVASGSHAFVLGGTSDAGVTQDLARANLAPQDPFFQAGVLGATVPGLKLEGEIGQQLGYLNAATVGAVNFIILILIGLAFNHRERTRSLWQRVRGRGRPGSV